MLTDSTEPGADTTARGRRRTTLSRRLATCAAALAAVIPAAAIAAQPAPRDQPRPDRHDPAPPRHDDPGAPPLTVTTGTGAPGQGDLFLTPTGDTSTYANGAEITDPTGKELWFHQAPAGDVDADFRPQTLHGRPVLTFWEGTNFGGLSDGTDYIYNDHYQQIAAIHAGDGLTTDGHEFQVTNHGTAWVLSYDTATVDLSSIGGPTDQSVIEAYVQEIDIRTGRVLFSWNAADHVPYSQSEQPLPDLGEHPVGLVPRQRGQAPAGRQPAGRRPRHLDDLQGQRPQRTDHLAARRQGLELQAGGGPRPVAERRRRDLRLAARP